MGAVSFPCLLSEHIVLPLAMQNRNLVQFYPSAVYFLLLLLSLVMMYDAGKHSLNFRYYIKASQIVGKKPNLLNTKGGSEIHCGEINTGCTLLLNRPHIFCL